MRISTCGAIALTLMLSIAAIPAIASSGSNSGDVALAHRASFRVTDFPSGFSQVPDLSKDTGCFSGPVKRNSPTAYVKAKRYSTGDNGTDATEVVAVFGTATGARRALNGVAASSSFRCYDVKLPALLSPSKLKLDSFTGGPLSFDQVGDVVRAFRYKGEVELSGEKDAFYLDYVFVVRGRVLVSAAFIGKSGEPDVYSEHSILEKGASRVPAA